MRTYFLFLLNLKDMKVATTIFGKSPQGEAALKGKGWAILKISLNVNMIERNLKKCFDTLMKQSVQN